MFQPTQPNLGYLALDLEVFGKWHTRIYQLGADHLNTPKVQSLASKPTREKAATYLSCTCILIQIQTHALIHDTDKCVGLIWVCLKIGYIPNYSHLIG